MQNIVIIVTTVTGAEKKSMGQTCGWRFPQEIQPEPIDFFSRKDTRQQSKGVTFAPAKRRVLRSLG
jgi:hypothetical protein